MANIPIWSGTATFNSSLSPTAFGFYDNDDEFATDAPNVAKWCAQRLGYPLVDVELQQENFFTAFEEAVTEYGTQVYQFQVINNIGNLIGYSTGSKDDIIDPDTGETIKGEGFNNIIVSNVYPGTTTTTQDASSYTTAISDTKVYSASLDVKQGVQKYNLLSSTPEYASITLEWGAGQDLSPTSSAVWGKTVDGVLRSPIDHTASIAITDTNGVTVHYRATTGSSAGGYNLGISADNPTTPDDPNMVTGSGEFRRYKHISASAGEFVTGSYVGKSLGLNGIQGSNGFGTSGVGHLSASFDSFISTLKTGPHKDSFIISSSLSSSGAHFLKLTQKVEGAGGNTKITLNNMTGVTASGVTTTTSDSDGFPGEITASFSGGSSGVSFEVSGSQIQARTKRIQIEKIYHYQPAAINRYFDPYAGTGTGIQSLMQTFGFGNYSPGVNFMLMPMYFDALKLQAIEMNDKIRKSAYHFELTGRFLRLFPIPTSDYKLWFDYTMSNSSNDLTTGAGHSAGDVDDDEEFPKDLITDQSNVPYKNPIYSFINAIGKQWIRKYALALCKEMLGSVRGKYQSVPIPGDETTLDYSRLLSEASAEKEALITQLRDDLDLTTTVSQNERQSNEAQFAQSTAQADDPYQIYIH
tara:strand:+ start:677 stop:2590 length:1914 start_codon:yes stop_codon:yes gene_type:complete